MTLANSSPILSSDINTELDGYVTRIQTEVDSVIPLTQLNFTFSKVYTGTTEALRRVTFSVPDDMFLKEICCWVETDGSPSVSVSLTATSLIESITVSGSISSPNGNTTRYYLGSNPEQILLKNGSYTLTATSDQVSGESDFFIGLVLESKRRGY